MPSDGLRGARAVLDRAQPHDRAVRHVGAGAVLVAIVVAAGAHHRQGAAPAFRAPAVQQLAHTLAKISRQKSVQQRIQAGVHIRDQKS